MSLTLFKNITTELSELEKSTLAAMLVDTLKFTHSSNRITAKNLCGWFRACGYQVTEVRIRKMVNYIRVLNLTDGKVVMGASTGYYLTEDPKEIEDQIESLQGRVDSSLAVIDSLKAQLVSMKGRRA